MKTLPQLALGVLVFCASSFSWLYAQGGTGTIVSQTPVFGQNPIGHQGIPSVTEVSPEPGAQGVSLEQPVAIMLSHRVDPTTVTSASIFATSGGATLAATLSVSLNRRVITMDFPGPLPALTEVTVNVDGGSLKTMTGASIDADQDGSPGGLGQFSFFTAPPLGQGTGLIVGRVFRSDGTPLEGAVVTTVLFPATEGDPPLPVPPGITDANGDFTYTTIPITGATSFLVQVRKPGFTESLREVTLMAEGCWRIDDTFLQPVAPPVLVKMDVGGTLMDATGTVELVIPPGALLKDSNIAITILESSDYIRDKLPELVADVGTFVDFAGVFGDTTSIPVTLRVPNTLNLPLIDPNTNQPTRVPMGKVDHNTLEWMDLRDAYGGPGSPPDSFLGTVVPRGAGGTAIEIQLDHFCTVCVAHCRNIPQGSSAGDDNSGGGNPDCSGDGTPGYSTDNSVVGLHEGQLWEYIDLPTFIEFEQESPFQLGYSSAAASSSVTLSAMVDYDDVRPVERTTFSYSIEGVVTSGSYDYSENNQKPVSTYLWDGRSVLGTYLPTGSYPYRVQTMSLNSDVKVSLPAVFGGEPVSIQQALTFPGLTEMRQDPLDLRATLVNLRESPYGAGWSLMCESRLYLDPDGCIVLVQGNGDHRQFHPSTADAYRWDSPMGEPSVLTADPASSTYLRTWPTGQTQTFNASGRILSMTDVYGFEMVYTYTGDLLTRIVTRTGNVYNISYDSAGKLSQIVDSAGRSSSFVVDSNGDLRQYTSAVSAVHSFQYDQDHLLERHDRPRGDHSTYAYNRGRIETVRAYDTQVRGAGLLRQREFRPSVVPADLASGLSAGLGSVLNPIPLVDDFVDVMVDGRGFASRIRTNTMGKAILVTDELGRETSYTYNAEGLTDSITNSAGGRIEYSYNAIGDLAERRELDAFNQTVAVQTYESNGPFTKLSRVTDADGFDLSLTYHPTGTLESYALGGPAHVLEYLDPVFPHLASRMTMGTGEVLEFTYDSHGNVATVKDFPDAVAYPQGRTMTLEYDASGRLEFATDHAGATSQLSYDAVGRPVQMTLDSGDSLVLTYEDVGTGLPTDSLGMVTYENGATLQYVFDGLNRLVERVDQQGLSTQYGYDPEGNQVSVLNRNAEVITNGFDEAGRLVLRTLPGRDRTEYEYDTLDNPISLSNDTCSVAFEWDELGRVIASETRIDSVLAGGAVAPIVHRLDYTNTASGRISGVADSTGFIDTTYTYDALGGMDIVTAAAIGQSWDWTRDTAGRPVSVTRAGSNDTTSYAYDGAGVMTGVSFLSDPNEGVDYGPQDTRGSITSAVFKLLGTSTATGYGYDTTDQLTSMDQGLSDGDQRPSITYTYDSANRLTLDSEHSYTFDAEGRMTSRASLSDSKVERFSYNALGQLIQVEHEAQVAGAPTVVMTAEYAYDPLGRRVERCINGVSTRYVYDRGNPILEIDSNSEVEFAYVFGDGLDQPIAVTDVVGSRNLYYHADRQGNVIALSDDAGSIVQTYRYGEHGAVIESEDEGLMQPFLFTGREYDPESGLYYFRNRYYHPELGRFMTEDPSGIAGGLNLYAFGDNNSVNRVDPLGLRADNFSWEQLKRDQVVAELRTQHGIKDVERFIEVADWANVFRSPGLKLNPKDIAAKAVEELAKKGINIASTGQSGPDNGILFGFFNGGALEMVAERNAAIDYAAGKGYAFDD